MLRRKTRGYPDLEHYLEARPKVPVAEGLKPTVVATAASAMLMGVGVVEHSVLFFLGLAGAFGFGYRAMRERKALPSAEERLKAQADPIAKTLRDAIAHRRLDRDLHPEVASLLNDCAGYWRRVGSILNGPAWTDPAVQPHWRSVRENSLRAANASMDEAMVIAGPAIRLRGPRTGPNTVQDLLDTFVFAPKAELEPLPPEFASIRELADRLRALSREVESAATDLHRTEPAARPYDATRRLDEVLSELRTLQHAEEELRQDARG